MLKQGTIQTAVPDASVPGSLSHCGELPSWPVGSSGVPMNWGKIPTGNYHLPGSWDFGKDFRVLPAIQNANNNTSLETGKNEDTENIEMGTKLNPVRRIEYLEKSIQFLKVQHHELVTSLHEEVDRLQRKNKELQFCLVMMQQNIRSDKEQDKKKHNISTSQTAPKEPNRSNQEEELGRVEQTNDGSPRNDELSNQLQGSDKLEELKLLFLEEEMKELRKVLENEQKQNQYLTELLNKAQQEKEAAAIAAAAASDNQAKSDVHGESTDGSQPTKGMADVVLPYGATLDPLLVHLPSQPARPPTLRECQVIARHLQQINNRQAHELNQLKTDLRDVLYSHKWTPDAYLLARAYVADDDAAEANQQSNRSLPRIPMKHSTKKLPESAYAAQESVTLPPLKTVVGNQAIERQKRTQCLQKTKFAKHGL